MPASTARPTTINCTYGSGLLHRTPPEPGRYLDQAADSRAPILVTRQGGKANVVIVAEDEWAGWKKTVHLLSNPANAARVLQPIRQADAGELHEHNLIQAAPSKRT